MSDKITSLKRNTEEPKRFSSIKRNKKKKEKEKWPMAAEDDNWAIISVGSF